MIPDYRSVIGAVRGKRRGLSSGTCATAAAKGAAIALLSGRAPERVTLRLPPGKRPYAGRLIGIPLSALEPGGEAARAVVVKDAGDDVDATDGLAIGATVTVTKLSDVSAPPVIVRGGSGVGVVERPGLPVAVGQAAINPVPRAMLERELGALVRKARAAGRLGPDEGLVATIDVPEGVAVAARTWNPRIGVSGGLSIIGTSGVVEPKSSAAFKKTIDRTLKAYRAAGVAAPVITPGYVGERFLREAGVPDGAVVSVADHIGFTLERAAKAGCTEAYLVGHVGKLVKVAAGLFNTHCRYGDARLETLAALAAAEGAERALVERILGLGLAEEAVPLILDAGLGAVFTRLARRASERSCLLSGLRVGCVVLGLDASVLGAWPGADGGLGALKGSL